jgi:hypothetical protein
MNTKPHRSLARHAALSPFDIQVTQGTPRPSAPDEGGHDSQFRPDGTAQDAGYGCVEWYQYPGSRADAIRTAN